MKKRTWKTILTTAAILALVLVLGACGQSSGGSGASNELDEEQVDSLLQQIAESEIVLNYVDTLPEKALANAEIFAVERDGDAGTAYAYLSTGEYAEVKGKAYLVSGGSGVAIIKFDYTEDGPALKEVVWAVDGSDQDAWLEENLPEDVLAAVQGYEADELNAALDAKAGEAMGVPVETENLLVIDAEKGTYEITKVIESGEGEDYTFDTETIEKGKLSDLAK